MNKFHDLDTTGWLEFPFAVNGLPFVSKINPDYPLLPKIKAIGTDGFAKMNKSAVLELGILADSFEDMIAQIRIANEYATNCVFELVVA